MTDELNIGNGSEEILETVARITPQWLAGFFDGDGHVGISRYKSTGGKYYLRLKVKFTGKDCTTLSLIGSMYGFESGPYFKNSPKYKSEVYELDMGGKKAAEFLRKIKDYVVIRRKQVELALQFSDELHVGSGHTWTEEQFQRGVYLRNQISELNGAGRKLVQMTSQVVEKE